MQSTIMHKPISYLLIAAGGFLLYLGARDLIEWQMGQKRIAREFSRPPAPVVTNPVPPRRTPPPPPRPHLGDPVAKLSIPRLSAQLYVVEGDGPRQLRQGPGHMQTSAMPGANGNCVIAGHRDTHFRVLKDIHPGDDIVLATKSAEYHYRVKSTQIVSPDNVSSLKPSNDAELHLITCYPFYYVGSAPKRFIVRAELAVSASNGGA